MAFVDAHGIPRPLVNQPIGPDTVDALWPAQRLMVAVDSRQAHLTRRRPAARARREAYPRSMSPIPGEPLDPKAPELTTSDGRKETYACSRLRAAASTSNTTSSATSSK